MAASYAPIYECSPSTAHVDMPNLLTTTPQLFSDDHDDQSTLVHSQFLNHPFYYTPCYEYSNAVELETAANEEEEDDEDSGDLDTTWNYTQTAVAGELHDFEHRASSRSSLASSASPYAAPRSADSAYCTSSAASDYDFYADPLAETTLASVDSSAHQTFNFDTSSQPAHFYSYEQTPQHLQQVLIQHNQHLAHLLSPIRKYREQLGQRQARKSVENARRKFSMTHRIRPKQKAVAHITASTHRKSKKSNSSVRRWQAEIASRLDETQTTRSQFNSLITRPQKETPPPNVYLPPHHGSHHALLSRDFYN